MDRREVGRDSICGCNGIGGFWFDSRGLLTSVFICSIVRVGLIAFDTVLNDLAFRTKLLVMCRFLLRDFLMLSANWNCSSWGIALLLVFLFGVIESSTKCRGELSA